MNIVNTTQEDYYEDNAYNTLLKRCGDKIKNSKQTDRKCNYDCVIKDYKDKNYLVELKQYYSNYDDCERIKINYNGGILLPKFTCNQKKFTLLYNIFLNEKEQVDGVIGFNFFNDKTTKVKISDYFEILKYKDKIEEYKYSKYKDHINIYNGNNQGKSQFLFGNNKKQCVFQENAKSIFQNGNQEFKIAFF